MADFTTHNGREITVDVHAISHKEYRALINGDGGNDEAVIAKACGLPVEDVEALSERDWRGLVMAVVKRITNPDPH